MYYSAVDIYLLYKISIDEPKCGKSFIMMHDTNLNSKALCQAYSLFTSRELIIIFHIYFFNKDISLIIALICLKIWMYIPYMYMEEILSQIFDIGFSFCFIVCRRWKLEKNYKQSQKLPVFCHKKN